MSSVDKDCPLVSVVVPAWNAEATLDETLRSVAAQTYPNLEIIIVDDGSTDRTSVIAERFCAAESRARLTRKENGGVASARNRGIGVANGMWVAPVDADDLWHPTKIAKQVAAALSAPELPGLVYCWSRSVNEKGFVIGSGERWSVAGKAFERLAYLNVVGNGSALLLSRDAVLEVGGYDEKLHAQRAQGCEDMMIQLDVGYRWPVAVVPEHLVAWRRHGKNMSGDFDQILRSWRLVYRRIVEEGAPIPSSVLRWVAGKTAFDIGEYRASQGRYLTAASKVIEAVAKDPVRFGLLIAYRTVRSAARRLSRQRPVGELVHFNEIDPTEEYSGDPYEWPRFARLVQQLENRRLARLAQRCGTT